MTILYNGNDHAIETPCTVKEFIVEVGKSRIALSVKLNGSFLPKKVWKNVILREGDNLNVIFLMGGG